VGAGEVVPPPEVAEVKPPRLSLWKVNFYELYERHLCRHSQYGINVAHLGTVIGSYWALFTLAALALNSLSVNSLWVLAIPLPYFVVLALNVPARVVAACVVFVALFFAAFFALPLMPWWAAVALIPLMHWLQNVSHRYWNKEYDMTEFKKKYQKGLTLFVLLSFYELPILLNYLVFDWRAAERGQPRMPGA
jgi:hypothetical protein